MPVNRSASRTVQGYANSANRKKAIYGPDSPQYIDARRDHAVARIEDAIQRTLAEAPPLTNDQADKLASLLRGGCVR